MQQSVNYMVQMNKKVAFMKQHSKDNYRPQNVVA